MEDCSIVAMCWHPGNVCLDRPVFECLGVTVRAVLRILESVAIRYRIGGRRVDRGSIYAAASSSSVYYNVY